MTYSRIKRKRNDFVFVAIYYTKYETPK